MEEKTFYEVVNDLKQIKNPLEGKELYVSAELYNHFLKVSIPHTDFAYLMGIPVKLSPLLPVTLDDGRIIHWQLLEKIKEEIPKFDFPELPIKNFPVFTSFHSKTV